ncbi:hypothetical protein CEXT_632941 [Caerostris extrusa]|uniref:Uncharacterized protein n=1 Tax=Caerostris extrusa TaxID=172846 RepID=A0AAV4MYG6_CAEEX|nr:hypothetical protein CEXT_632941 [Caerostris extrusa]
MLISAGIRERSALSYSWDTPVKVILPLIKREAFNVPTCKLTIGVLDDSISINLRAPYGASYYTRDESEEFSIASGLKFFILEQISEKAKESFDISTSEVSPLAKRSEISLP